LQASSPFIAHTLLSARILKAGVYTLWISMGTRTGAPRIALSLENEDGARRYRLGEIRFWIRVPRCRRRQRRWFRSTSRGRKAAGMYN
jgi:hypothetical protein